MTHSIAFGGFATYRNMTWDTALVQKEKKKTFGDIVTESIFSALNSQNATYLRMYNYEELINYF